MHEYGIAYDIVTTARHAAVENNAKYVTKVFVDVGELSMINPEQIEFLFSTLVEEDPLFQGVELVCRPVKPHTSCTCGYDGDEIFVCPVCGSLPKIVSGKDVFVSNIEIEAEEE